MPTGPKLGRPARGVVAAATRVRRLQSTAMTTARPHIRPFRDRRGRGARGPLLPQQSPRFRSRSELFDAAVLEAYAPLQNSYARELSGVDIAVDTVPRMRLRTDMTVLPDEIIADGPVPLGRLLPAGVDVQGRPTRARFVVFRMPIEERTTNHAERAELLSTVLTALVATYLNVEPQDIDSRFNW